MGALCERAGGLHKRAGDSAATLHGRVCAMGPLHGRVTLHERAETGALRERVGALCERSCVLSGEGWPSPPSIF